MADDFDAAAAETKLRQLREEKQDVTANLPNDWEKQLDNAAIISCSQLVQQASPLL